MKNNFFNPKNYLVAILALFFLSAPSTFSATETALNIEDISDLLSTNYNFQPIQKSNIGLPAFMKGGKFLFGIGLVICTLFTYWLYRRISKKEENPSGTNVQ